MALMERVAVKVGLGPPSLAAPERVTVPDRGTQKGRKRTARGARVSSPPERTVRMLGDGTLCTTVSRRDRMIAELAATSRTVGIKHLGLMLDAAKYWSRP